MLTRDAHGVVADPDIDLVVEVIGGIEPARELIIDRARGRQAGRHREQGAARQRRRRAVRDRRRRRASTCCSRPRSPAASRSIRALRESLRGEPIRRVLGIVNGTTNYILTKMTEEGADYGDALAEAQRLGYAERDPTADVEGFDAGAKAAIIASIAFGAKVVAGDVYHEGISGITAADIAVARRLGYVVKLLGIAERDPATGEIAVRVHPAMVPVHHPLASVRESYNAVFVEGDAVGSLMFYGRGAGGLPTASAVLGDVIDAAVNLRKGTHGIARHVRQGRDPADRRDVAPSTCSASRSPTSPGVLHAVTGVFADHGVSIRAAEQEGIGDDARLVFITHEAQRGRRAGDRARAARPRRRAPASAACCA